MYPMPRVSFVFFQDIVFKHKDKGKDNQSYRTSILPEKQWKIQQVARLTFLSVFSFCPFLVKVKLTLCTNCENKITLHAMTGVLSFLNNGVWWPSWIIFMATGRQNDVTTYFFNSPSHNLLNTSKSQTLR